MEVPTGSLEQDHSKEILLPEAGSGAVQGFEAAYGKDLPVWVNEMTLQAALDLLEKKEVAAVLAGAEYTTGEVIKAGIEKFNPRRNPDGEIDSLGERRLVSSFFLFERHGDDPFLLADCAVVAEPSEHELLQIADQTVENARRLGINPHVAFLSYSTLGSGRGHSASKIRAVVGDFRKKHKDIPTIGEVQFDAATDAEIYRKKTGQEFPGEEAPNIFIAPDLNSGNIAYKIIQNPRIGGGWTAVGPLLQGFEGGHNLHDLSRGVTPDALAVICKYIAKLSGITEMAASGEQPEP